MKKILLLIYLTMFASFFESFAQISSFPWTEDFEYDTIPEGFSFIDADNDGNNWVCVWSGQQYVHIGHNSSSFVMGSVLFDSTDNWMVLPFISTPSIYHFEISWYEKTYDTKSSSYSVYISNTGRSIDDFIANGAILTSTATNAWTKKSINIINNTGQPMNIAIRHHNSAGTVGSSLMIDDIEITAFYEDSDGLYYSDTTRTTVIGCSESVTNLILPNSVTTIEAASFSNHTNILSVTIPSGVSIIGNNAFDGCCNIASVNYNAVNSQAYFTFQNLASLTTLNIGNEVQYIPDGMFSHCTGLVTLNVPNAVSEIGGAAFYGCSNLTSIILGNGLEAIGNYAFSQCTRLTSVSFGEGLETIGNDAFSQCTRLTSVSFGEGIANIGDNAFLNCGIIGELVIPQGVISIGDSGFKDCFGITEITCLGRVAPTLGSNAFDGVDTGITINIPCGTTNLYAGRWSYFHNFNEIPFLFNVASANLAQGTVAMLQEPTCNDPVAIVQATPRDGYRFDHWSDGSTQNPYTYTAMGSLTLTAYFASTTEGINDIEMDGIRLLSVDGRIVVESGDGGTLGEVRVFDVTGRMLSEAHPALSGHPSRGEGTGWRAEFEVPASGMYVVKIGDQTARKIVVIR